MKITHKISMDFQNRTVQPRLNMVQCDYDSRQIEITVTSGGAIWKPESVDTVFLRYRKSDGTGGSYDTLPDGTTAWSVEENRLLLLVAPQMLTVPGLVEAQAAVVSGSQTVATFSFQIAVEADPSADSIQSENYINWAEWTKEELEHLLLQAKESGDFAGACYVPAVDAEGNLSWTNDAGMENPEMVNIADLIAERLGGDILQGDMSGDLNMNGFKITEMAEPESDHDAATKGYTLGLMKKAAPRNLLDNSDFLHFIAQAGIGGSHGTQAYAGDRWILDSGNVTGVVNENGDGYSQITLNGTIRQKVANSPEGDFVCGVEMVSGTADISYADGAVTITSAGGVMANAGLYEGTMLPEYQPKGYTVELAECQRYYYRLVPPGSSGVMAFGFCYTAAVARMTVILPQKMRVLPTFNYVTGTYLRVCHGTEYADVTGLTLQEMPGNYVILYAASSGMTQRAPATLMASYGTFEFSADL